MSDTRHKYSKTELAPNMQNDWTEKIHCGDALAMLSQMPDKMVQCIVTSPPYYGLRQYLPNLVKLKDDAPEWVIKRIESLGVKSLEDPPY